MTVVIPVLFALLFTRQILPYDAMSETILFITTIIVCYGIGSWFLLKYVEKASKDLREKSTFIRLIHLLVTAMQFVFLGILIFVLFSGEQILPGIVYAVSSAFATILLGLTSFKFFSWFRVNKKNFVVLIFGLATASLAMVIANDAWSKLLLVRVIEEPTPDDAALGSFWVYRYEEKYPGYVQHRFVKDDTTLTYLVPPEYFPLYGAVNFVSQFWRVFVWVGIAALLYQYYRRFGSFPKRYWAFLCIPLILFLIGSNLVLNLPSDTPNRAYYQLIFRIGTIATSILFALSFLIVARSIPDSRETAARIKDYLTFSAIGIVIIGISFSASALQQTYGIAAHSMALLSSYLFSFGLYFSAVTIAYDTSVRRSIRNISGSTFLSAIGTAQNEQEKRKYVRKVIEKEQEDLEEQIGFQLPLYDPKPYESEVLVQPSIDRESRV